MSTTLQISMASHIITASHMCLRRHISVYGVTDMFTASETCPRRHRYFNGVTDMSTASQIRPRRQIYVHDATDVSKASQICHWCHIHIHGYVCVKWSVVQCREGGKNETLWEKFIWVVKWWEVKGWGESVSTVCVGKNNRNCIQYFLTLALFTFCTWFILRCLVCIV